MKQLGKIYHIVAIPKSTDLILLNNLRNNVYQNNFRFKNKSLSSDTHMTLGEVDLEDNQIEILKQVLREKISTMPLQISEDEWVLTKEKKNANYKMGKPYIWIALKFSQRKEIYKQISELTETIGINRNERYRKEVERIENKAGEYLANHINLSNYTRVEKGEECWEYFKTNLPTSITFDTLALRDLQGRHIFEIKY